MPRVAVVMPALNAEATIGQTLESVTRQTFDDFEVVVVDDGSTDGTPAIASSFDPRVRCVQEGHRGVSRSRNRGVEVSEAPYIAFLDADDIWEPEKLERQVALLDARPEIDACYAGVWRVDAALAEIEQFPGREYDDLCEALLLHASVVTASQSNVMIRRPAHFAGGGYDSRFSQCADWDYLLRHSLLIRFAAIPDLLVRYRSAPGNMSSDVALLERDTLGVLDAFFARDIPERYRRLKRRTYSNHWMILSGSYLGTGRLADSLRCLARGLALSPANVTKPLMLPVRRGRRAFQAGPR